MINIENITQLKKRTLGLTIVLTAAAMAFAQEKQQVSGKIVDAQKNLVPYASVTFKNKTVKENATLYSDATLTDDKGNFNLNLIPGSYEITIEAIDFKKTIITKQINVGANNLGELKLEQEATTTNTKTKDIEGVTLTAATKPYKVELDKRTYDVSADITSKGGNLQDILQNVPSVSVETDGTVSMRGNSNVRFLINGKPSSMLGIDDNANALQSIPADQIEKIEVITNPSSKFESAGTAGILNIILKKTKKTGFNGSVEGTLGYLPTTRLNTNLSWRKGNLTYYINGGGGYNEGKFTSRNDYKLNTTVISPVNNTLLNSHQESITNNYNKSYNVTTGLSYDFSPRTSLSTSLMLRGSNSDSKSNTDYAENIYSDTGSFLQNTNRFSDGLGKNLSFQADASLDHKIDNNGQLISFAASFQNSNNENNSDIKETTSTSFGNDVSKQNSKNRTILLKSDYELPIGKKSKLEAGLRFDANKNDYDYEVTRSTNGSPAQILPLYTSNTVYDENISAAYAQFKSKLGEKLSYQLGLRAENTNIELTFDRADGLNKIVPKDYTNLFPTVFLSYDISKNNQFLLNYTERIRRPRSFFLIPFMSLNNNRNLFEGNPDLNPSLVHSYEFGYSLQKTKFSITPTFYYRNTVDDIKMYQERTLDANNNTVITTKPINLGTEQNYGLDLNTSVDITKWWKVMANLDLFGYKTKGEYQGIDYSGDGFSSRIRLTNTFRPDKNTSFQIQSFYRGGQKTASNEQKAMYAISLGANRTIWKGNGTISFNIQDIFNTRARETEFTTDTYTNSSYMQMMPRTFTISLSYRFKQGEKVDSQKRKKDINNNDQGGDDMPPM